MIKFRLPDLLHNESQVEFAKRVDLSRQTVQKIYSNQAKAVELDTLEKICKGLGIGIGELLVLEGIQFEQRLRDVRDVNIVYGARLVMLPKGTTEKLAVGRGDVESLSSITGAMTHLSMERLDVETHLFQEFGQWDSPDHEEQAMDLLKHSRGVLFILGGDLVNGFAHYCLDKILEIGYDPRGMKPRAPQRMKLPYQIHKKLEGLGYLTYQRPLTVNQKDEDQQGIWNVRNERLVVKTTSAKQLDESQPGQEITDAAIVYIDQPNRHHPASLVVGIVGFSGKGTALVSKQIFIKENLKYIDKQLQQADDPTPQPIFLVARVTYTIGGAAENVEFIEASKPLS